MRIVIAEFDVQRKWLSFPGNHEESPAQRERHPQEQAAAITPCSRTITASTTDRQGLVLRDFMLPSINVDVARPSGPVPVRSAATVMLLRNGDTDCGVEVFMIRRARLMAFAGGMAAFPGGAQEDQDGDVVDTAIRETEEECGVRVERPDLRLWARWLTPEFEPRRYDTYFFATEIPAGVAPRATNGEAEAAFWVSTRSAVSRHRQGDLPMLPPTLVMLEELAAAADVAGVLATPRRVVRVEPWRTTDAEGRAVLRVDLDGRGGGRPRSEVDPR